jgi:alginate O-acetyltransferase complex protein AlgI
VFFLCGLWHGANWTFVIWGIYHGLFLVIERGSFGTLVRSAPHVVKHTYVLLVVLVGWVFFRAGTVHEAVQFLMALVSQAGQDNAAALRDILNPELVVAILIGTIGMFPWIPFASRYSKVDSVRRIALAMCLILSLMVSMSTGFSPFLYFRF